MSRFAKVLSDVDARLRVPEPARSRILLELSADMEDLFQEYLSRGVGEEGAEAEVIEHFDLSEEALDELVQVHDTPLQRSLEYLSVPVRGPWSRLLMVVLAVFFLAGSGTLLVQGGLYRDASVLVWGIVPLLALGLAMAVGQALRLYRAGNAWRPGLGSGLGRLLGSAVLILVLAAGGLWVELYLSALGIRSAPGNTLVHLVHWLHMASATLVVALSGALILGFLWFFLGARVRRLEVRASSDLLGGIR